METGCFVNFFVLLSVVYVQQSAFYNYVLERLCADIDVLGIGSVSVHIGLASGMATAGP